MATARSADQGSQCDVLAFYLPQYHPIPENSEWWGTGFTEWENVRRARPLFPGHLQPSKPSALGYYDLRNYGTRYEQAQMARDHGVTAFVYWHYWFGQGKRLLERPFSEVLRSGEPDFPFALAWANESWTRRWYGDKRTVLMRQRYPGVADAHNHFSVLAEAFADRRYYRVDERPLLFVYRPLDIPDVRGLTALWRSLARRAGLPGLYLVSGEPSVDPERLGFDAAYCQPRLLGKNVLVKDVRALVSAASQKSLKVGGPVRLSYRRVVSSFASRRRRRWRVHPGVLPNWDNTPRKGHNGTVLLGSNPERFRVHLEGEIKRMMTDYGDRPRIFLKSWNEWAEGNYVEPDERNGMAWLEAVKMATRSGRVS